MLQTCYLNQDEPMMKPFSSRDQLVEYHMAAQTTNPSELLFSTQLRLAPEAQPLRESAIDCIVERAVYAFGVDYRPTLDELCHSTVMRPDGKNQFLQRETIEAAIQRLISVNRVKYDESMSIRKYSLPDSVFRDLAHEYDEHKKKMARVISLAFSELDVSAGLVSLFVTCLYNIFSDLGAMYANVLVGTTKADSAAGHPSIKLAVEKVAKERSGDEKRQLGEALRRFISSNDPEAEHIKWVLGQNFYIAKSLGLDEGAQTLSRDAFAKASFYLDTNVALAALAPQAKHHNSFASFISACKALDVTLWVSGVSCRELEETARGAARLIRQVEKEIPDATAPKIDNLFWSIYKEEQGRNPDVDVYEVMSRFDDPSTQLQARYDVKYVDDRWFGDAENTRKTNLLANDVRTATEKKRRPKNKLACFHDALMLQWIELERKKHNPKTWLLTLDYSLPNTDSSSNSAATGLWVTLEAIVHWLAPYLTQPDQKRDFAALFSEMLRLQVLPQRRLFDLNDFRVLASMELQCKNLPPKDVEACVRRIHKLTTIIDPSTAEGRERLSHEIRKFMADPNREFRRESEDRKSQLEQVEERLEISLKNEKEANAKVVIYKVAIVMCIWITLSVISGGWLITRNPSQSIGDSLLSGIDFLLIVAAVVFGVGACWIGPRRLKTLPAVVRRIFGST